MSRPDARANSMGSKARPAFRARFADSLDSGAARITSWPRAACQTAVSNVGVLATGPTGRRKRMEKMQDRKYLTNLRRNAG